MDAVDGEEPFTRFDRIDVIRAGGDLLVDVAVVGMDGAQEHQAGGLGRGLEVLGKVLVGAGGRTSMFAAYLRDDLDQQNIAAALAMADAPEGFNIFMRVPAARPDLELPQLGLAAGELNRSAVMADAASPQRALP